MSVTLTGTNFASGAVVRVDPLTGSGAVTANVVSVVSSTQILAIFDIGTVSAGFYDVSVRPLLGTSSNTVSFTVLPAVPTITNINPASGLQGATVPVTITGSGFLASGLSVNVSGAGVTASGVTASGNAQINATLTIAANASPGARNVTVVTSGGTSNPVTFTVNQSAPTLSSISPSSASRGVTVPVTLTGANFTSPCSVNSVNGGITPSACTVITPTSITATFTIASNASLGAGNITVTTPAGTSNSVNFTVTNPPPPTLTSITPNTGAHGTNVPFTLMGTNFVPGATTINWPGSIIASTVTSSTVITGTFSIGFNMTPGPVSVTVTTAGGTSNPVTFTVLVSPPTLASINPPNGQRGSSSIVFLTGDNFISPTTINVPTGITVSGVSVSIPNQVVATFTIAANAPLGGSNVSVTTPDGTSNPLTFTVNAPVPTLSSISPSSGLQGATVPVTLTGTNFTSPCTVNAANGGITPGACTVVTPTSITATFAIAGGAASGAGNVTVTTPGGTSNAATFTVNQGAPTLSSISPPNGLQGATVPVTLTGTNFTSPCSVNAANGGITPSGCTVVTATSITATFTIAGGAAPGAGNITVTTPGGTSNAVTFTVNQGAPTLSSISPSSGLQGDTVPVTLTGTNFTSPCSVNAANGGITPSACTVVTATSITATFTIAGGAAPGAGNVTVTTPGGTSNAVIFTVNQGAPTLSSISPSSGLQGATVPVTLTGTNFISPCSVNAANGGITPSACTVVTATSITATFTIAGNATTGSTNVTVTTPRGTSNTQSFTITAVGSPTLTSISPASGVQGATVPVTLTGTNFTSPCSVNAANGGITPSGCTVVSPTSITATFTIAGSTATGSTTVTVTTPGGPSNAVTFTVNPPPPTLTSISPSSGVRGTSVPVTLTGTNFASGSSVNVPAGITVGGLSVVNPTQITATLVLASNAAAGSVSVSTSGGTSNTVPFTVVPAATISCTPTTGPTQVGTFYSATCTASGGTTPYNWSIGTGALPSGLTLSGTTGGSVNVSGTPTASGPYAYGLRVTDSTAPTAQAATQNYTGNINGVLTLLCNPATGPTQAGVFYSSSCAVTGGAGPYTWSIASGALPAGVAFSSTTGAAVVISGTPTSATASYNYTVRVSDNSAPTSQAATQNFVGTIQPPPPPGLNLTCTPTAGPTQVGVAYSATCTASGGTAPYNWSIVSGTLPAGMSLSATSGSTVAISGTPTSSGKYSYTVRIADSTTPVSLTASQPYSGTLVEQLVPAVPNCSPATGPTVVGVAYSTTCTGSGGTAPYSWSISGTLPAGLSLSGASGTSVTVSGTPTASGPYNYAVVMTDSSTPTQTAKQSFNGTIPPAPLQVTPPTLSFHYQVGGSVPPQQLSVSPRGTYTVAVEGTGCSWLTASLDVPTGIITATANQAGLDPRTYNCTIAVSGGGSRQDVFVSFIVDGPSLVVDPSSLNFSYLLGGSAPVAQSVSVRSSNAGAAISFSATAGCTWVTVSPASGTTPGNLSVSVNPTGFTQNTNCPVTITASAASNSPQTIPVALVVSSPPSVKPSTVVLTAKQGSSTAVLQSILVSGPATPVGFTASASTSSGGPWLSLDKSSGTTPASVGVQTNPTGLVQGTYTGKVTINFDGGQSANVDVLFTVVPVTVTVSSLQPFHFQQGSPPPSPQVLSIFTSDNSTLPFTYAPTGPAGQITVTAGPGPQNLTVSAGGALSAGTYTNTISVKPTGANPAELSVPVTIVVDSPPVAAPVLTVKPSEMKFSFVLGTSAGTQVLSASNQGGGTLNVTASAKTSSGGGWLTVSPSQAALTNGVPVGFTVSADPSKVIPNVAGTYSGQIVLTGDVGNQSVQIPVTMTLSALPNILLSRPGLSYSVVKGGTSPPSDTVDILNAGLSALNWTAQASTLSGGSWLKIGSPGGSVNAGTPVSLPVSVDPTAFPSGIAAGTYYGSVVIAATDAGSGLPAANSPQTVAVVLNVLETGGYLSPIVRPSGLIITADAGTSNVPAQTISVSNQAPTPISYSSVAVTDDGANWCSLSPATGTVVQSNSLSVQVDYGKLTAGLHVCNLRLRFADGSVQTVAVSAVVTAPGSATLASARLSTAQAVAPQAGSGCNTLVVSLKQPGQGFTVIAFQPTDIEVEVQDNCGHPVDLGSGTTPSVFFISGISDPTQHPAPVGKGLYRGSWTPTNVSRNVAQTTVTIQVVAQTLAYPQAGSAPLVTGTVALQVKDPTLIRNIANSASYAPAGQVAPCGWVAIFGENLADSQTPATDLPLGPTLGGTSAMLGGKSLPLIYVDNTQINAQIPCGLQPNTEHDLQVTHKNAQSVTSQVVVAETQPAVFTVNQAGFGQGAIFGVAADGTRFLADSNHPVHAGDTVEIYCTGLGPVSPAVTEGNPSPSSPPLPVVAQDVRVSIGGVSAELSFKGLTPGAVGLYQVNAVIPAGLPVGYSDLPIVVTVGGHESQPGVTLGVDGGRAN